MPDKDKSARANAQKMRKTYDVVIGIDTGVHTGLSVWNVKEKCLGAVDTMRIHEAMEIVSGYVPVNCLVRVEDARKRTWFGNAGREKLQGAGSIKRDATIWEDFFTDLKVDFEMVAPKNNSTKMDAKTFKAMTGYNGSTTDHGRDAGMLVFGY